MEYIVYDYISEKYLPGGNQSSWPLIYREGVVIPESSQGLMKQSRGSVIPGELGGVLEDCPGLMLPLGRGDPKDGS
ncbi:hypothetical protein SPSYN_00623 [Sporotomaculum syntrophicum]|uniref:Uncharacterized protein n=1 Tax=Sporotomaculum syntrophicum TaxID=182264 RepID=A0A9D2WRR8_9FIRM|nr:hypothetical protein [Sporotomaculum syntrophicum]KAF1085893.1 hypothetical protein SPSYN_00623 [Sporotomaculum syntrophicum]